MVGNRAWRCSSCRWLNRLETINPCYLEIYQESNLRRPSDSHPHEHGGERFKVRQGLDETVLEFFGSDLCVKIRTLSQWSCSMAMRFSEPVLHVCVAPINSFTSLARPFKTDFRIVLRAWPFVPAPSRPPRSIARRVFLKVLPSRSPWVWGASSPRHLRSVAQQYNSISSHSPAHLLSTSTALCP